MRLFIFLMSFCLFSFADTPEVEISQFFSHTSTLGKAYILEDKDGKLQISDILGALENLCQSGSISNTKGLNDGNTDRHRGDITTNT